MLKFIFMILSMFMITFYKKKFWMVQFNFFLISFVFMFKMNMNYYYTNLTYMLGSDFISYGLILLSMWICALMIMASEKIFYLKIKYNLFLLMVIFLNLMLILTFSTYNMFLFYLFFECSLIPTFFLILGWGYQPERLQAGYYLLFYTLLASLPLLISILFCHKFLGSVNYFMLVMDLKLNLLYLCLIMAFLVKMPMFLLHLWLPKAHVEAPVSGSMILAGVLLKLGGYGMLRVFVLIQSLAIKFNLVWYTISLVGGIIISLVCLFQVDIKSLIAYSSVAHMGVVISGLVTMSYWGVLGSYVLMIGHGLCSSGLFCLVNLIYERTGSRSLFINKGLMNFMPSMALWWFLLLSSNMAAPPSLNLLGEIMLFNSIISFTWLSIFLLSLLSFFSAAYTLYLYSYSQHGIIYSLTKSFCMNSCREYLLMFLHWAPLNMLIIKVDYFCLWL